MIAYEEICQALDRFNARRRNEAELADLEHVPQEGAVDSNPEDAAPDAQVDHDDAAAMAGGEEAAAITDTAPQPAPTFDEQPPEDTQEIDVDDVEIDERLSEEKLPGE